ATPLPPDETAYFGAPLGTEDGEVTAVDAATGEVLWATEVPGDPLGGTAVVNDLVVTALLDGTVLALDRATGEIVWTFDAGDGVNGWMSVVGDELFVPVGNAAPPQLLALRVG
ncbi:MAG TPA: PQQ-binding-like beta-propeller repeat protein, partial [Acidimicrobiales bacterium]